MPALSEEQLHHLKTRPPDRCRNCGYEIWQNYCRQCDEFFWVGHSVFCKKATPGGDDDHCEHRTY